MVQLSAIGAANAEFVNKQSLVAVFVGATSGIGEFTLRELVKTRSQQGKGLYIYLVGRKAEAAKKIIEECSTQHPNARFHFVPAKDLSLMQDIDKAVSDINEHLQQNPPSDSGPRVDLLFMSQGGLYIGERQETEEGLEFSMSMHYYSRARFAYQLLPLLRASTLPTAHVVSVCAAGMEDKLITDDLTLDKPENYGFINRRSHCCFMTTMFFEQLASDNSDKLSLVNMFPGLVITPAFYNDNYPLWFRIAWRVMSPFAWLIAISAEEAGQRVLFLATERFPAKKSSAPEQPAIGVATGTDGQLGSGAYAVNNDGEPTSESKRTKANEGLPQSYSEASKLVWDHTMEVFNIAAAGKRYTK